MSTKPTAARCLYCSKSAPFTFKSISKANLSICKVGSMKLQAPISNQLQGAFKKLQRAAEHLERIKDEISRCTAPGAFTLEVEVTEGGAFHEWYVTLLTEPNSELSLWIGDCLHNLRSSLDHIAFELIKDANLHPTQNTIFPLLKSIPVRPVFINPRPGPEPDALHLVELVQPYNSGGSSSPLWLLSELNIIDKHRELVAVVSAIETPYFGSPSGVTVKYTLAFGGPLTQRTRVMVARVDPPLPAGALDGHVTLTVKFSEELNLVPISSALTVDEILTSGLSDLASVVIPKFDDYFGGRSAQT